MKRLFIATFLLISFVAILAVTNKASKKEACKQNICCTKKCPESGKKTPRTDYIFWEPIGRLMIIPQ